VSNSAAYQFDARLILLGFFVALFSAGIGIGGGALLVPILISAFGFDFKKAASTSLATIIPISLVGSISQFIFLAEAPHLQYYFIFIPTCMLGTILGWMMIRLHRGRHLKIAFSIFLFIISLRMLEIFNLTSLMYKGLNGILFSNEWLLIIAVGIAIGIIAVLLGIGCGLLIVPFFVIIVDFNIHEAITLSLTAMFFLTLSSTIIHNKFKTLDITQAKSLFIPALPGAVVGATISSHIPTLILNKLFGVFLFITACSYIVHEIVMHYKSAASAESNGKGIA